MKHFLARGSSAVLVAAASLSAACSNDPTAPQAPSGARSRTARSNYVGATAGTPATGTIGGKVGTSDGASTNSGYVISWGKDGQPTPPPAE